MDANRAMERKVDCAAFGRFCDRLEALEVGGRGVLTRREVRQEATGGRGLVDEGFAVELETPAEPKPISTGNIAIQHNQQAIDNCRIGSVLPTLSGPGTASCTRAARLPELAGTPGGFRAGCSSGCCLRGSPPQRCWCPRTCRCLTIVAHSSGIEFDILYIFVEAGKTD